MSCNLNIVKNFRLSRTLFVQEDGSPTIFYATKPSDALRDIIEGGGGVLLTEHEMEVSTDPCIKLCDTRNDPEIKQGYLPISYIKHCVMRNKLISEQFYRENQLGQGHGQTSSPLDKTDESSPDSQCGPSKVMVCPQIMGRKKYSLAEDLNIIKYLVKHKALPQVGGNKVWRKMEALKITDHSYQSMRDRYLKSILPSIHQYDIPSDWISKLTKSYRTWGQDEDEMTNDDEGEVEEEEANGFEEEDQDTLDPETVMDRPEKPNIELAKEKSTGSTSQLASEVSESHRNSFPETVGVVCLSGSENSVGRTLHTNAVAEEDVPLESNGVIEVFSLKTDNPSIRCTVKDPNSTSSSSLADNDDVDKWIVKEISAQDEREDQGQGPSTAEATVTDDQRLQPCHVHVPRSQEFQPSPPKGRHFHPEDFASKQLTKHRLEAIMRHYNISQSEAVYLWLKHPHRFWQIC